MGLVDKARDAVGFGISQVTGFMKILKLKLRIIGFADKRNGLFMKLGEITYKASKNGADPIAQERSAAYIEEIKMTELEISSAENDINKRKSKSGSERETFMAQKKEDSGEPGVQAEDKYGA
ncbi:hypothetical protein MNBD_NITROSPINAE03-1799 [hydrothermal vent metagenome]|uniref:Uncharacterized protein n=1 Tax=hydrothermal vent metagenome TaxID=652676 RepID=A0A3B1CJW8_9ZZZZ